MDITGNTVLITGGGTGIGLALAAALYERGNEVVICGRRRSRLRTAQARLPGIRIRVCDVSNHRSRQAMADWLESEFKGLNILVNNAGIQRVVDFRKGVRDLPDADDEIATNLAAPIHLSAMLIPRLKRRKAAAIVNVSSGLAFAPIAAMPVYCATKAALHSWSLSLRHQLRGTSVRVFEIAPPMVATELSGRRDRGEDEDYIMSADAVAGGILAALRRNRYEAALGSAAYLRRQREKAFAGMNG
jgi:uncharacterized oxidoreductase